MKVGLLSPYSDITAYGLRILSAYLKANGIETAMLFIPHEPPTHTLLKRKAPRYNQRVLERVKAFAGNVDAIGISLMTNYFEGAIELTQAIKASADIPVIWGGIHPTIRPLQCLEHADYVVIGEGEEAFLELLNAMNRDPKDIPNISFRSGSEQVINPPRKLLQDLDALPFPDYSLDDHYLIDDGDELVEFTPGLLHEYMFRGGISRVFERTGYQTLTTRGCPHYCTYCCNNALKSIYSGQKYLRRRSIDNIISELTLMLERFDFIEIIGFSDDSFFAAREDYIKRFAKSYKANIGKTFFCLGSPRTITKGKIEALMDAGLAAVQMGIQTASPRTKQLYKRNISPVQELEMVRMLVGYHPRLRAIFDFIIDNPMETLQDNIATLRFIQQMPYPFDLQLFSLAPFPGTQMADLLHSLGYLPDDETNWHTQEYHLRKPTYVNFLFALYRRKVNKRLMRLLSFPPLIRLLSSRFFKPFFSALYWAFRAIKRGLRLNG